MWSASCDRLNMARFRTPALQEPEEETGFQRDSAPRRWIENSQSRVFAEGPTRGREVSLSEVPWQRFERRGECVIPAIEKAKEGDNGDHLKDLILVEVAPQLCKMGIAYAIGNLTGGLCEPQSSAFGVVKFRARLVSPDLLHFARGNGE